MLMGMMIRPAQPKEAQILTDLMLRSKAHWGYDAQFMADAEVELVVRPEDFAVCGQFVLEVDRQIAGFSTLCDRGEALLLDNLFVEPEWIGQGVGKRLWEHAVDFARRGKYTAIILVADPYAVGFYEKAGAVVVGETPSGIRVGRMLSRMRYDL